MLTANVGFLAIPGVVLSNLGGKNITNESQVIIFTSPAQIASSLSMIANVGSIVNGLLLVRFNRARSKENPGGAVCVYLHSIYDLSNNIALVGISRSKHPQTFRS
jgi:hypothetical protein